MHKSALLVIIALLGTVLAQDPMLLLGDAVTPPSGVEIPSSGCDPEHPAYCSWNLESTPLVEGFFSIFFVDANLTITIVANDSYIISGDLDVTPPHTQGEILEAGNWKINIVFDTVSQAGHYTFSRVHSDIGNMELYGPAFPDGYNVSVVECVASECLWEDPAALADAAGSVFLRIYDQDGETTNVTMFQTQGNSTIVSGSLAIAGVSNTTLPQTGEYTVAIAYNFVTHVGNFLFIHSSVPPPPPTAPVPMAPPITPQPPTPVAPATPATPPVTSPDAPVSPPTLSPDAPFEPPTTTIPESKSPAITQNGKNTVITYGAIMGAAVIVAATCTIAFAVKGAA